MNHRALSAGVVGVFVVACAVVIFNALAEPKHEGAAGSDPAISSANLGAPSGAAIDVLLSTSGGKKEWVEDVVRAFHASHAEIEHKPIRVSLLHMKSGE